MDIIDILIKIAIGVVGVLISLALTSLKTWIETKISQEKLNKIKNYAQIFTRSAEQTLKEIDPTGEKRKKYVESQLSSIGININDEVLNIIESAVFEINHMNKNN